MEYLTGYYRQQGESGSSLLLQQYLCWQMPVCFACLCDCPGEKGRDAARYITGQLLEWCRHFSWTKAVKRPEVWLNRAERKLKKEIRRCSEELREAGLLLEREEANLALVLCVGEEILMVNEGQAVWLLNTAYGRGEAKPLRGNFRGSMEAGVGVLMATEDFLENIGEKTLGETLHPGELSTQEGVDRHLRELAKQGETDGGDGRRGNCVKSAILLLTKGGEGHRERL